MHVVELGFELKSQLNFFFVVFSVLHVFFFELKSHLSLINSFSLQLFTVFLKDLHVLSQDLIVVGLFLKLLLVVFVKLVNFSLVLFRYFRYEHSVVCSAAVL